MITDEEAFIAAVCVVRKYWNLVRRVEEVRGNKLCVAVTFMRTSSGPGVGISLIPVVTGMPSCVTNKAF